MKKILIVEDMLLIQTNLEALLSESYEVTACSTGEEALKTNRDFDLLIIDLNLGEGITGIELVERFREEEYKGLVVILTAYDDSRARMKAVKLEVNGFFPKSKTGIRQLA